ncbi:MAG: TraR/DksA C4-type zinc finger protein [Candidatus Marinimicrobia bacterium]|jgi:DnaK suppressor protein|nr:TraR/DksA C4-type zinc finger protein [Candidatus Neomarinimicrobiota bacterium]
MVKKRSKRKLTQKERKHFRKIIEQKRQDVLEQLIIKKQSLKDSSPSGGAQIDSAYAFHMADSATDGQEREKAFQQFARENKYLTYLNDALERVENDSKYGFCIECGYRITNDRLEEVPHTRHCIECKSKVK